MNVILIISETGSIPVAVDKADDLNDVAIEYGRSYPHVKRVEDLDGNVLWRRE